MSLDPITPAQSRSLDPSLRFDAPGVGAPTPRATPEDVKKAAKQFEAILVRQLLAPAVEPMMQGSLGGAGGTGAGVYGYMLTDALANSISQGGGLGFAEMIETQLSPHVDPSTSLP